MTVPRRGLSKGINFLVRTALVAVVGAVLAVTAWGQSKFIRTPAEATDAQRWVSPSYFGFPLNETNPTYYGGLDSRLYYGYGRGTGYADMIGYRMPINKWLPDDKLSSWFTSHPDTGAIYVRSGRPVPPPGQGLPDAVARFRIEVPASATVWIEDKQTTQTGPSRNFVSPPLLPGKSYLYDIRIAGRRMAGRRSRNRRLACRPAR